MEGFFSRAEILNDMQTTVKSGSNCITCGLYRGCVNPKMGAQTSPQAQTLLLTDRPTENDDKSGKYLSGASGDLLKMKFMKARYNLERDFHRYAAVHCHTKDMNNAAIASCRSKVMETIEKLQPNNIVLLGDEPIYSLLGDFFRNTSVFRFRGLIIPDQRLKTWLLPTFNPRFILKREKDYNAQAFYDHEINRILRHIRQNKEVPVISDQMDRVDTITDFQTICDALQRYLQYDKLAIDYETTGLKPYVQGHKIVSVSIDNGERSISFPFEYRQFFTDKQRAEIRKYLKLIWENKRIKKIAHNAKFEHIWSKQLIKAEPVNWHWCTLMGAHCQDNRQKFSGLKFQVYVNFGHVPYNDEVAPYIDSHGEEFNNIDECPLNILLPYGGLDTRWCYRLYEKQEQFYEQNPKMKEAFDLFNEGTIALGDVQHNGIPVDEEYCIKEQSRLKERIEVIEQVLLNSEEAKKFQQYTGRPLQIKEKDFSDHDLRILFYDILGYETDKTTEKSGSKSVDKDTLAEFNTPFVKNILKRRKFRKMEGTYLGQFLRCTYDGMMRPFFDLVVPVSYRGSAYDPNFQNIPKRDEQAKKCTRRAIKPYPGWKILESDFSGIEVCINACYNQDPTLIADVTDPEQDMHRDSASDLFILPTDEVAKMIRFYAKNCWVFPQFYGSWYLECAKNLWKNCLQLETNGGFTINDHLKSKGIISFEQFSEQCKRVERKFWEERFKVYAQWKKEIQKEYRNKGYVETFLGFRFSQLMTRNEVTNYDAQGTAFHCLLWTLIQVLRTMKEENMQSKLMGQIHDSMLTNLHPDEEKMQIQIIDHWGTDMIRKHWKWITVPLKIDHEATKIDGTWYEKLEIK